MPNPATQLSKLADVSDRYDGVLSDVWGVLHNAIVPNPSAVSALTDFRKTGGHVVLITNASRTGPEIQKMLDKMGVPREAYDAIVTSGEVTRALIAPYADGAIHHVGPATDHPIFKGLNITKRPAEEARAVVVTGMDAPDHTPDYYSDRLASWLELGLPLICANPDKIVEVGDRMVYCAGSLADVYAEMGGKVALAGKPYAPIYNASMAAIDKVAGRAVPHNRVLAIGDSVRTDATGAADAGIDFLFITGSIHADEIKASNADIQTTVSDLVKPSGVNLVGFQERLT